MTDFNLKEWFSHRPKWIQVLAKRILEGNEFTEADYDTFAELCIKEVLGEITCPSFEIPESTFGEGASDPLRLTSIMNVEGINALAPQKPLEFGTENLSVVYGLNGSGKSGYVRILKHVCGARHPGNLHKNIYSESSPDQKCRITYEKDGKVVTFDWSPQDGIVDDLRCVDIFDTLCGSVYATDENEVTYEPPVLSFFSELINTCEQVSKKLDQYIEKANTSKPQLPQEFASLDLGKWYLALSANTSSDEISKNCDWSEPSEEELLTLQKRISEKAPLEKAKQVRRQKQHIDTLIEGIKTTFEKLSDENCTRILDLKRISLTKKGAAEAAAKKVFSEAPLEGIGAEQWKELWEKARQYSEQIAYTGTPFPNTQENARCVLCQQSLSDEAINRFQSFESFVKGELEKEVTESETTFNKAIINPEQLPTEDSLKTTADAAGITEGESVTSLISFHKQFRDRQEKLLFVNSIEGLPELPLCQEWLKKAEGISQTYDEIAKQYDKDGESDNRSELESSILLLQTRKWLTQQREPIRKEAERLKQVEILKAARSLASTTWLSRKKGELAEQLITDAFVARFNRELKALGANKVKIELVKTRVDKGRVLHQLRLCGSSHCTLDDVLSEGEYRIISLATFLADVVGKVHSAPFVFDDPISSLDQDYEEAVVQRLVELSRDRQLIILTHRLSLLGMLQDYGKKAGREPKVICVRQEAWGAGEPGGTPFFAKQPEKALNALMNDRLNGARKIYEEQGQEFYEPVAKSLCSDFRILLERMIEHELLADVVHRYRRAINTAGKIDKLARISVSDCKFFDDMMTKYSRYEHSQSLETPAPAPLPDELATDFEALKAWRDGFVRRITK